MLAWSDRVSQHWCQLGDGDLRLNRLHLSAVDGDGRVLPHAEQPIAYTPSILIMVSATDGMEDVLSATSVPKGKADPILLSVRNATDTLLVAIANRRTGSGLCEPLHGHCRIDGPVPPTNEYLDKHQGATRL